MVDQVALQRRMSACFNGTIRRECSTCPGHHTETARCCFGCRFDPNDTEECGECRHQVDCQQETARYENNMAMQRPQPIRSYSSPTTIRPISVGAPPAPARPVNRIPIGAEPIQETAFEIFMKEAVWEAFKGFFTGALGFFNTYRWR
jgi:hypothetical protein